jgi:hypothetical protein
MSSTQGVAQNSATNLNLEEDKVPEKIEEGTASAVLLPTEKKLFTISIGESKIFEFDISKENRKRMNSPEAICAAGAIGGYLVACLGINLIGFAVGAIAAGTIKNVVKAIRKMDLSDKQNQNAGS